VEAGHTYDTDLTDAEWNGLGPLVPAAKPGGRPVKHPRREIVNGIFYRSQWQCLETAPAWSAAVANRLSLLLVVAP